MKASVCQLKFLNFCLPREGAFVVALHVNFDKCHLCYFGIYLLVFTDSHFTYKKYYKYFIYMRKTLLMQCQQ